MPQYNNSVENVSKILSQFSHVRPNWGISELAKELKFPKTTAYNLIRTLEKIGFLVLNENSRKYELGKRIANLASIMVANLDINQKGAGLVQELATTYDLGCSIGIWDEDAVLMVFSSTWHNIPEFRNFKAGPRIEAYCSALGRSILAYHEKKEIKRYLDNANLFKFTPKTKIKKSEILREIVETKARGFSIIDEELSPGGASFGAPIFDKNRSVLGAISIYGHADRILGPEKQKIINSLCFKALQISQSFGYGV